MKLTESQRKVLQTMADYEHGCAVFGTPSRQFRRGYDVHLKMPLIHTSLSIRWFLEEGLIERVKLMIYRITPKGREKLNA
jgi:hypothetical protein